MVCSCGSAICSMGARRAASGPIATPRCASTPSRDARTRRVGTLRRARAARARPPGLASRRIRAGQARIAPRRRESAIRMALPAESRIVIIGGGVIGCSIAYHLAKRGERDVVLLERLQLTHGATWHAAGLVGQLRSSSNLTRLMRYGAELYGKLEAETGQATGWQRRRQPAPRVVAGALAGVEALGDDGEGLRLPRRARVADSEARELFPLLEPAGVVGAAWIEGDGYVDPTSLTNAYAAGARAGGVTLLQGVRVTALGKARAARDDRGHRPGRHRSRVRDQRGRHVGPRDRGDGRHARSRVRRRAPVLRHRQDRPHSGRPADAARSRRQLLRQARTRCARRRRLGDEHATVGRRRHRARLRSRAAAARISSASRRSPRPRRRAFRC